MPAVYTRSGDKGTTGLYGGSRVSKLAPEVEAYGTLDEAIAAIGFAKTWLQDEFVSVLQQIQSRCFVAAAELASDATGRAKLGDVVGEADIAALEAIIDRCLEEAGKPKQFVIPGTDTGSAALHQARTVSRRAERRILALNEITPLRPELLKYLNRLSDTLFALARVEEHRFNQKFLKHAFGQAVRDVQKAREANQAVTAEQLTEIVAGSVAKVRESLLRHTLSAHEDNELADNEFTGTPKLNLAAAKALAAAAELKGAQMGVPIVFAAVDAGGNLILVHRMADSLLASIDIAMNKAFTAAALKTTTESLREGGGVDGSLYGIETSNDGRIVLFGGGLPVFETAYRSGSRVQKLSGGIGVSGGTVEEDLIIINHAYETVYGR